MSNEGLEETTNDLTQWLQKWKLSKYEDKLRSQGIESPQDFKYIKSKQQFDKFVLKLGDDVPYMHVLKLEDAWSTIVPISQQQPNTQIHFLGEKEREIMDKLYQRYNDSSDDVTTVQKATNEFNESVVQSKKMVNDSMDKIISGINNKRNELLNKIDVIHNKNKKILTQRLQLLQNVNKLCLKNKQLFETIASDINIAPTQKLSKLNKLLSLNMNADDDEKKMPNDNYDNYKIIGNKCIIPGKINANIDQQSFGTFINSFITINCDEITKEWKMLQNYISMESIQTTAVAAKPSITTFDKSFGDTYYTFNDNDKSATNKGGNYPSVKILPAVSKTNNTVKFIINGYGWYGIGDNQTNADGFAGYTDHGWMVRNSNAGIYAHNKAFGSLKPTHGDVAGKVVQMSFDSATRKLTVTIDNKQHVSEALDIDVQNSVYFLMTGSKITLIE